MSSEIYIHINLNIIQYCTVFEDYIEIQQKADLSRNLSQLVIAIQIIHIALYEL